MLRSNDASSSVPQRDVRRTMLLVLLALVPGVATQAWHFGPGVLLQIALTTGFALGFEAVMLKLRARSLPLFLGDLSASLTAVLFALCLPPLAAWWIALVGTAAAIIVAKHLYGGLGSNLFNPAMVAYAVVLVFFPEELARASAGYVTPDLAETARWIFASEQSGTLTQLASPNEMPIDTRASAWIAWAYLLGGVFLLWRRVIRWHVPTALIATTVLLALLLWMIDSTRLPSPFDPLLIASLMLAAFFIATDPVTGCITPRGRLIFGSGVAVLALIATANASSVTGAFAFAILLMNFAAPWIDLHTRPRRSKSDPAS